MVHQRTETSRGTLVSEAMTPVEDDVMLITDLQTYVIFTKKICRDDQLQV